MSTSPKPSLLSTFTTPKEQSEFLALMRVLTDDVADLSSLLGLELALAKLPEGDAVYKQLNRHPAFWQTVLLAQQTSLLVTIGRIYDTGKAACLKRITKFMATRKRLRHVAGLFEQIENKHADLIAKVNKLRNNVFAHSNENRSLHIAFGFEGLNWDELEDLCRGLVSACDALGDAIFDGQPFGPRLKANQLDEDLARAEKA